MPMPTVTSEKKEVFFGKLLSELSAFIHGLLEMEIPGELSSARFGITHFDHPEVVAAITNLAPEMRLMELIDAQLFEGPLKEPWEATVMELEKS